MIWQLVNEGTDREQYEYRDHDRDIYARVYEDSGEWYYEASIQGVCSLAGSADTADEAKELTDREIYHVWFEGRE